MDNRTIASLRGWPKIWAATVVLVLSQPLVAQQAPPLVFVLAGQSNMAGQGVTADLTTEQATVPPNVKFFLGSQQTLFSEQPRFGPEVALAHELAQAWPNREIWLIKHAVGGTSLPAWAPSWDSTRAASTNNAADGPLYHQLIGLIEQVHLQAGTEFGAVFWMQGERDARFPEAAREYFGNLSQLVAAFRRDLRSPGLPFVLGLVNPPLETYPGLPTVRRAQREAAAEIPNVYVVETDDLTKRNDHLHYDTAGLLELGRRFAATVRRLRAPSAPP